MDYAGLTAVQTAAELGDATGRPSSPTGCKNAYGFWGAKTYTNDRCPRPAAILSGESTQVFTAFSRAAATILHRDVEEGHSI